MSMVVGLRNGSFCSIRRPSFAPLHHGAVNHLLRPDSGSPPQTHPGRERKPNRKKKDAPTARLASLGALESGCHRGGPPEGGKAGASL